MKTRMGVNIKGDVNNTDTTIGGVYEGLLYFNQ